MKIVYCLVAKSCSALLQLTRLLCPWNFPGKNTGVGCHFLPQGFFPTQGSNPRFVHCQADSLLLSHQGGPTLGRSQYVKYTPSLIKWLNFYLNKKGSNLDHKFKVCEQSVYISNPCSVIVERKRFVSLLHKDNTVDESRSVPGEDSHKCRACSRMQTFLRKG